MVIKSIVLSVFKFNKNKKNIKKIIKLFNNKNNNLLLLNLNKNLTVNLLFINKIFIIIMSTIIIPIIQ